MSRKRAKRRRHDDPRNPVPVPAPPLPAPPLPAPPLPAPPLPAPPLPAPPVPDPSGPGPPPRKRKETITVKPNGLFFGSTATLTPRQTAGDIYLQDFWRTVGDVRRVVTVCSAWGMSLAFVQVATKAPGGELSTPWEYELSSLPLLNVNDYGQEHVAREDVPVLPNDPDDGVGGMFMNGVYRVGYFIPWHHRVVMKAGNGQPLHYHEHGRRNDHRLPSILPHGVGNHWIMDSVRYTTQVQNCRRAIGK